MKEITIENKTTVTKYETSDGKTFERKDRAEIHEKYMGFREKVKLLKNIGNAYYCKTQEDFDVIVDWYAHQDPYYDFNNSTYKPRYEYSKSNFEGEDWYFFEWEYQDNAADDYWVETLSQKKAEWEEFYNQFK